MAEPLEAQAWRYRGRIRGGIGEIQGDTGRYRGDMSVTFASKPSRSLLHGPSGHCPRNVRSITSTRAEANLHQVRRGLGLGLL